MEKQVVSLKTKLAALDEETADLEKRLAQETDSSALVALDPDGEFAWSPTWSSSTGGQFLLDSEPAGETPRPARERQPTLCWRPMSGAPAAVRRSIRSISEEPMAGAAIVMRRALEPESVRFYSKYI